MEKYLKYIELFQDNNKLVVDWIGSVLNNYLSKNNEDQNEIEHVLDYLCSSDAPKRLNRMSYKEAVNSSKKWTKSLIKKGININESKEDTEIVLKQSKGFKWVKLIGKNAFEREGLLMSHCVASYFKKDVDVYSLRDKHNNPHCTVERDNQIKGKGNGNISPKYIGYVVDFLEHLGMSVSDNEMKNLGYFNIEKYKNDLHKDSLKLSFKNYLPISSKLLNKKKEPYFNLDLINDLGLIDSKGEIIIDLSLLDIGIKLLIDSINSHNASSGDSSHNASSGDYSHNASSGNYSHNASSGYSSHNASNGYYSHNASSGDSSHNSSSGDYSKNASSGDYSTWFIKGEKNVVASVGYKDKVKAVKGTWVTLAEYKEDEKGVYVVHNVVSKKIDGKILKENTYYTLINGKFTKTN